MLSQALASSNPTLLPVVFALLSLLVWPGLCSRTAVVNKAFAYKHPILFLQWGPLLLIITHFRPSNLQKPPIRTPVQIRCRISFRTESKYQTSTVTGTALCEQPSTQTRMPPAPSTWDCKGIYLWAGLEIHFVKYHQPKVSAWEQQLGAGNFLWGKLEGPEEGLWRDWKACQSA